MAVSEMDYMNIGGGINGIPDFHLTVNTNGVSTYTVTGLTDIPRFISIAYTNATYGVVNFWCDVENEKIYRQWSNNGTMYQMDEIQFSTYITSISSTEFTVYLGNTFNHDISFYVWY